LSRPACSHVKEIAKEAGGMKPRPALYGRVLF
jgi:hypothetical protein